METHSLSVGLNITLEYWRFLTNLIDVRPHLIHINNFVVVDSCSGETGYFWSVGYSGTHLELINNYNTRKFNSLQLLSSTSNGASFTVEANGASGYYQKWDFK
jgi:hypothetical protein